MKRVLFLMVLCACPPPKSNDAEAQSLAKDLTTLDDAATTTMRVSPNDTGLGNVEVYMQSKKEALHERVLQLQGATLGPAASAALTKAYTKNVSTAHVVQDDINNAVPKETPATRARAKKLAAQICEITETPTFKTECDPFRTPNE